MGEKVPRDVAAGFAESSQKYYLDLQKAKTLLKVAQCPNDHCIGGGIPLQTSDQGDFELEQCQWCAERKELLN